MRLPAYVAATRLGAALLLVAAVAGAAGVVGFGLVVAHETPAVPGADAAGPKDGCEEAKRTHRWCKAANVGYVAGVEIRSHLLYEALDAHGHDIAPGAACETCRKALQDGGFCPAHRIGYAGGLAYLTPLTYQIARSSRIDPEAISCSVCRAHTRGLGWCEEHKVGIAGRLALDDRQGFEQFAQSYQILLAAVEKSAACETCAAAMVVDGYCAEHRLIYRDGLATPNPQAPAPQAPPP